MHGRNNLTLILSMNNIKSDNIITFRTVQKPLHFLYVIFIPSNKINRNNRSNGISDEPFINVK